MGQGVCGGMVCTLLLKPVILQIEGPGLVYCWPAKVDVGFKGVASHIGGGVASHIAEGVAMASHTAEGVASHIAGVCG